MEKAKEEATRGGRGASVWAPRGGVCRLPCTIWSSLVTHTGPAPGTSSHSWQVYQAHSSSSQCVCALPIMVSSFRFATLPAAVSIARSSVACHICLHRVRCLSLSFCPLRLALSSWLLALVFLFSLLSASFACQVGHLRFHDRLFAIASSSFLLLHHFSAHISFVSFPFKRLSSASLLFCLSYL